MSYLLIVLSVVLQISLSQIISPSLNVVYIFPVTASTTGCRPDQIPQAYTTLSGTQGSEIESFAEYIDSFETTEAITFDSAIGQDGQTYLFLTKEQAETDGLIAQILDAGYGVTYEADVPEGEA